MASVYMRHLAPVFGFCAGYVGLQTAESYGLVSMDSVIRTVSLRGLQAQRFIQSYLPADAVAAYGMDQDELERRIRLLSNSPSATLARETDQNFFADVLDECRPREQVSFLEDHFLEEIPFFYISEIVFSWTRLHRNVYMRLGEGRNEKFKNSVYEGHISEEFESPILCQELWKKMTTGVIPFDVGVCALAILGETNVRNSEVLGTSILGKDLLREYQAYKYLAAQRLEAGEKPVVPDAEVATATITLLQAMNKGIGRRKGIGFVPFLKLRDTDTALRVDLSKAQWCQDVIPLMTPGAEAIMHEGTKTFIQKIDSTLSCAR